MSKHVLILGASGDIGKAIAIELASHGYQLVLHYHQNKHTIDRLQYVLREDAILQTVQANLADSKAVHQLCETIAYQIDAIVFVSGAAHYGLFQDVTESEMDYMIQLHVKAPWMITNYFLPQMIRKQQGQIILITSIWGNIGASNEVMYSSVKGAQNSFVKALAKEVGLSGISVNAVSPGFIDTKMNQHLLQEEKSEIISHIPVNRAGLTSDIAHAVGFLLDEKSNYIQGEIINISGGWF
ncbi:MAG TPA: SDR family oxidoreductase [Pseudogracilibacillus sp.]|nr:SDR family oxidoreductase [Pseudogracilibacillus sp.]